MRPARLACAGAALLMLGGLSACENFHWKKPEPPRPETMESEIIRSEESRRLEGLCRSVNDGYKPEDKRSKAPDRCPRTDRK